MASDNHPVTELWLGDTTPSASLGDIFYLNDATGALTFKGTAGAAAVAVTGAPTGAAGGDLNGTYPNPGVAKVAGTTPGAGGLAVLDDASTIVVRATLGLAIGGAPVVLLHPMMVGSAPAANLAATTFEAVSDPNLRQLVDLRELTKVRIHGRIGGTLVAATKIRIQYNVSPDPTIASGDGGWVTLADSAGSHTADAMFYSSEASVPSGAQVNPIQIRAGLYDGDGAADPTITACILTFYP